jgi:hypothetical protein
MKSQRSLVCLVLSAVLLVAVVGSSQAQAPRPQQVVTPQAVTGNAFTYQGYLEDGSSPANGKYDFQFNLYNDLTGGSQVGSAVTKDNVTVTNGLFSVALDFGSVFDGTGLWLEAGVRPGSSTGSYVILSPRQEITPAPYALSLKPGARIQGNSTSATLGGSDAGVYGEESLFGGAGVHGLASYTGPACAAWPTLQQSGGYFESRAEGCGYGVYGKGSTGVYGRSDASGGYGGRFENTAGGVAVSAIGSGIIKSTADTKIVASPFDLDSWSGVRVITSDRGYVYLQTSFVGSHQVHLPVTLPAQVFGVPQKLKSIEVCYQLDNAGSYINGIEVYYSSASGEPAYIFEDNTDRTSISWTCYTYNDPTPDPIQGSVVVRLYLHYAGTGWAHEIVIGSITLTLTEN